MPRKDNGKAIREVCRTFVALCRELDLLNVASVANFLMKWGHLLIGLSLVSGHGQRENLRRTEVIPPARPERHVDFSLWVCGAIRFRTPLFRGVVSRTTAAASPK